METIIHNPMKVAVTVDVLDSHGNRKLRIAAGEKAIVELGDCPHLRTNRGHVNVEVHSADW